MRVHALWRHPVKSMQGERVEELRITPRGVEHDRRYGVLDRATGTILSAKRDGELLRARALQTGPELVVCLPNGETVLGLGAGSDAALSSWLGRQVHLQEATEHSAGTYELHEDATDDDSPVHQWTGPEGSFVDSSPVHVLTTASLRAAQADVRRFRPNVVVTSDDDGFVEDDWVGALLHVGEAVLQAAKRCTRCAMVTRAQPGGLERDLDVFRSLARDHDASLGVLAWVVQPGVVRVGDAVRVERA
ncbi:MAG TPA: MOSC N-terminal beta barrel domain-containing protein [Acidimicrobiales bacterium]|nr:MOSC N-terminal beta barrel domain-containing protein [Acidimicrobiales bacterium]